MPTQPRHVVVVEDDAQIRRIIELKLRVAGYAVMTAADGETGLRLLREIEPEVLITDKHVPCLDGMRLCELAHEMKMDRPFLTLLVTGSSEVEHAAWAERLRDTRVIGKPFSPARLLNAVDEYCGVTR